MTEKSKDSVWIPWELGLGDGANAEHNVALFPSAQNYHEQSWADQEYLGLYPLIVWWNFQGEEPEWLVHNRRQNIGRRLRDWILN